MDLGRYFSRIGFDGAATPDEKTLRSLHRLHVEAIPFENLDVLMGRPIDIGLEAVFRKLVEARRGGYCFEHNTLFAAVLRAIGFEVEPLLARVRHNVPPGVRTPLTHMVLRVRLDGRPWLVDVGFGGAGSTAPLRLDTDDEQQTPHEPRRVLQRGGVAVAQARLGDEWKDLYESTLETPAPADFELGNWFSCTHPRAHFVNNLVVTRVDGTRRLIVANREFVVREPGGCAERREFGSLRELLALLAERFGLELPGDAPLRAPGFEE
jgi:N-hydroxyarylamine O-acetyltransferase